MVRWLIAHQWKESIRSSIWQKNVVINVVLAFFILYMLANLLFIGIFAGTIISKAFPGENPIDIVNGVLIYYFLIDIILRFYMQEMPVLGIRPYLHLPMQRSTLIHFLLSKSLLHLFNYLPLFLFVPIAFDLVAAQHSTGTVLIWLLAVIAMLGFDNFFTTYMKKQLGKRNLMVLGGLAVVIGLMVLDYFELLSLADVSIALFGFLLEQPYLVAIPVALLAVMYMVNFRFLMASTYIKESGKPTTSRSVGSGDISFLKRFGKTGELLALELKLIWRHKRTKTALLLSSIGLLYGLIFYTREDYLGSYYLLFFVGIFISGFFMINYGQFLISWEGGHFDGLLSQNFNFFDYFNAKYWLFLSTSTIIFLLSLPYAYYGIHIIWVNLAMLLFNIGVNSYILMFFATISPSKIDLSQSSVFNWQGVGASQFLVAIPIFGLPFLLYGPFAIFGAKMAGVITIGAIGLVGLLTHRFWLHLLAARLNDKKYKIANGFRQG